jgi:hypothetical protein
MITKPKRCRETQDYMTKKIWPERDGDVVEFRFQTTSGGKAAH